MKNIYTRLLNVSVCATLVLASNVVAAKSNSLLSLHNLERERAALINDFLDTEAEPQIRSQKVAMHQRQLADMERMVLRDERLLNTRDALFAKALAEYDLTFLVHAGAEKKRSASAQWLSQVNITNQSILSARAGFR